MAWLFISQTGDPPNLPNSAAPRPHKLPELAPPRPIRLLSTHEPPGRTPRTPRAPPPRSGRRAPSARPGRTARVRRRAGRGSRTPSRAAARRASGSPCCPRRRFAASSEENGSVRRPRTREAAPQGGGQMARAISTNARGERDRVVQSGERRNQEKSINRSEVRSVWSDSKPPITAPTGRDVESSRVGRRLARGARRLHSDAPDATSSSRRPRRD